MPKNKDKKLTKLTKLHRWLDKKVIELTEDRLEDRDSESKTLLLRLKKQKLAVKDYISQLTKPKDTV